MCLFIAGGVLQPFYRGSGIPQGPEDTDRPSWPWPTSGGLPPTFPAQRPGPWALSPVAGHKPSWSRPWPTACLPGLTSCLPCHHGLAWLSLGTPSCLTGGTWPLWWGKRSCHLAFCLESCSKLELPTFSRQGITDRIIHRECHIPALSGNLCLSLNN